MVPVIKLEDILKQQILFYKQIVKIEEEKSNAIADRDGKQIEILSMEQEALLHQISKLEDERIKTISDYRELNHLDDIAANITLKDIVRSMDEDSTHKLMQYAMQLKKIMMKIKNLQQTNNTLISDNIEFFNILLSGLKESASVKTGYSKEGDSKQIVSNSVLFNKTV